MLKLKKILNDIKERLSRIEWHTIRSKVTINIIIFILVLGLATFAFWFRWSAFKVQPLPLEPFVKGTPLPDVSEEDDSGFQALQGPFLQQQVTVDKSVYDSVEQDAVIESTMVEAVHESEETTIESIPPTDPAIAVEMAMAPSEWWQRPIDGKIVKSFGMVYWVTTNDWRTHTGIDIEVEAGSNVLAARAGTVQTIAQNEAWGWTVTLSHQDGYQTLYAACEEILVKEGAFVEAGQVIAKAGNSAALEMGLGSHLHFEVRYRGEALDPTAFLPQS